MEHLNFITTFFCRYLDTYEKFYFLGEEEEDESNPYFDEEDSRARKERQRKIVQNVPTSYNEAQHRVADHLRAHYGLSTELYQKTDYDRLGLSLLSPLPNEQDFAINVCTLLSNEGRHTLKLAKCPRLLDILLVSTNIFASLINIFCNVYNKILPSGARRGVQPPQLTTVRGGQLPVRPEL